VARWLLLLLLLLLLLPTNMTEPFCISIAIDDIGDAFALVPPRIMVDSSSSIGISISNSSSSSSSSSSSRILKDV